MSLNINEMIRAVKRAAIEAVNAQKPCNVFYGVVTKAAPLEILVEQKMTLTAAQLVLSRNVTKHTIEVEFTPEDWLTELESAHKHGIKGKKKLTLHNELKAGEKVILLRCAGGQSFVVIDRLGGG